MKLFCALLFALLVPAQAFAQTTPGAAPGSAVATPTPLPGMTDAGPKVDVASGDEISVRLLSNIGSRISNEGDTFAVETISDYYFQGKLILPKGTPGYGTVTHVKRAGSFHSGGELKIALAKLIAPNRRELHVEVQGATGDANKDTEVNGNTFGQYALWGFVGLFSKKGNDILIKKGAQFHVVTQENKDAVVIPYGTNPAPLDLGLVTADGK